MGGGQAINILLAISSLPGDFVWL